MHHVQLDLGRAARAARKIAKDPDDLPQVFTMIESLSLDSLQRIYNRVAKSAGGRRLLETRPDIVKLLADREALRKLPEGSLGRAYLDFVESENISAQGIRDAQEKGSMHSLEVPEELRFIRGRMRDTHDLWHAAVGYRGDVLGEAALLAFTLGQTFNPAVLAIIAIALFKTSAYSPNARAVVFDGYARGRRAAFLAEQEWESMLHLPLVEVRRRLSLDETPKYEPVRSSVIKARSASAN